MTYFDRTEISTQLQPSPDHLRFVLTIIKRASEVWTTNAPKRDSELTTDLVNRMKWKNQKLIEEAFEQLKNTHDSNFFPKPAKWQQAFDYIGENFQPARKGFCEELELVDYNERSIPLWEKRVIDLVKIFGDDQALGKQAKQEKWWGAIFDDGRIPPFGLANYLAEIYTYQFFILKIWPKIDGERRPVRSIEEFHYTKRNDEFREWLNSPIFYAKTKEYGIVDINLYRPEDAHEIRRKRLELMA